MKKKMLRKKFSSFENLSMEEYSSKIDCKISASVGWAMLV